MNHSFSVLREKKKRIVYIKFISVCSVSMNIVTDVRTFHSSPFVPFAQLYRYQNVFYLQLENSTTTYDDLEVKVERISKWKKQRERKVQMDK